jgi:hypothetical protein
VDKVEGFGEADAFPSDEAEARWIWLEFTRPFGFPVGGHPLCRAASDDGKTSASPPSAWIVSPSAKQNWLNLDKICSNLVLGSSTALVNRQFHVFSTYYRDYPHRASGQESPTVHMHCLSRYEASCRAGKIEHRSRNFFRCAASANQCTCRIMVRRLASR